MQVNLNTLTPRMSFKANKNNNTINYAYNNQIAFGDSFHSHTTKSSFDKFIKKIGLNKAVNGSKAQVFEISLNSPFDYNQPDADMINFYSSYWNINPIDTLFIASERDDYDCPFVVFNTFSCDASDNEKMQLYVLESPHRGLTEAQRAAFKLFYTDETRRQFQKGSLNNPLSGLSNENSSKEINSKIKKLARNVQNPTWAKYCADAEKLDPVIFSADGSMKYWLNPKNI